MPLLPLLVATLAGLAVGVERQWSGHATGVNARFGGLRTFTLIGLVSGIAGWWTQSGLTPHAVVLIAGLVAIVAIGYVAASKRDVDATTEVAALVVIAAGIAAGSGHTAVASATTAVTVLFLSEKSMLHRMVGRIGEVEIRAAARFAVLAAVVLPLLPEEPLGPVGPLGEVRLRQLWILVLFFSGLSFLGFVARRAVGPKQGYAITGALGGLVSSTAVTLTFSRLSRNHESQGTVLASGVMGANVMLFPRVMVAAAVLSPPLATQLWPGFLAPIAIGLILMARGVGQSDGKTVTDDKNPLQLGAALQMAAMFQVVLFLVSLADERFGAAGLFASAAVLGLTDVDALTVSMAQRASTGTDASLAAAALTLGILANTVVKASIALVVGRGRFRLLAAAGLIAMAGAMGAWLIVRS